MRKSLSFPDFGVIFYYVAEIENLGYIPKKKCYKKKYICVSLFFLNINHITLNYKKTPEREDTCLVHCRFLKDLVEDVSPNRNE